MRSVNGSGQPGEGRRGGVGDGFPRDQDRERDHGTMAKDSTIQ